MSMGFAIGRNRYQTRIMHGRLFLNGVERSAIVHEDTKVIEVSDTVSLEEAVEAVAELVAETWQQSLSCGHVFPAALIPVHKITCPNEVPVPAPSAIDHGDDV